MTRNTGIIYYIGINERRPTENDEAGNSPHRAHPVVLEPNHGSRALLGRVRPIPLRNTTEPNVGSLGALYNSLIVHCIARFLPSFLPLPSLEHKLDWASLGP